MGSWLLDVIVAYTFKTINTIASLTRARGSRGWPVADGIVATARGLQPVLGCPTAYVVYGYTVEGKRLWGMHEEAFIFHSSAEDFARRFPPGKRVAVRYKPAEPTISIVRDEDQPSALSPTRQDG